MRRRKIGERALSSRIPEGVKQTKLKARDLSDSLDEFSHDYLGGAVIYSNLDQSDGYVTVCTYQTAYALRLAVEYGAPDRPVRVTTRIANGNFEMHIVIKDDLEIEALLEITRALRRAGFYVVPYESGVKAQVLLERDKILKIYEKSRRTFYQDLQTIFFV